MNEYPRQWLRLQIMGGWSLLLLWLQQKIRGCVPMILREFYAKNVLWADRRNLVAKSIQAKPCLSNLQLPDEWNLYDLAPQKEPRYTPPPYYQYTNLLKLISFLETLLSDAAPLPVNDNVAISIPNTVVAAAMSCPSPWSNAININTHTILNHKTIKELKKSPDATSKSATTRTP